MNLKYKTVCKMIIKKEKDNRFMFLNMNMIQRNKIFVFVTFLV